MPDLYTTFGPFTFRTYNLLLALALLCAAVVALLRLRLTVRPGALADAGLGGLIGTAAAGRLAHVLLNLDYFSFHPEIFRLDTGGLNWHGALVGALIGLGLAARWRHLDMRALLDALTPALPLLALAGWWGCTVMICGYGAEVDTLARYPAYAVAEARDVYGLVAPRYSTQSFGMLLAAALLALTVILMLVRPLYGVRFWIVLALLSAGMFAIGFVRGDAVPGFAGLRANQWLDLALLVVSFSAIGHAILIAVVKRRPKTEITPPAARPADVRGGR